MSHKEALIYQRLITLSIMICLQELKTIATELVVQAELEEEDAQ